jgi:hypothetical protein
VWSHIQCAGSAHARRESRQKQVPWYRLKRCQRLLYSRHSLHHAMARKPPPPPFVRHDPSKVLCGWCQREIVPGSQVFITPVPLRDVPEIQANPGHRVGLLIDGAPRYGMIPAWKVGRVKAGGGIVFFLCSTGCAGELRDAFVSASGERPEFLVH